MDGDGESIKNNKTKREKTNIVQRHVTYVGNVFSSVGLRRLIQVNDGNNWFILGSRYRFLFNFRMFLVMLYISYEIPK